MLINPIKLFILAFGFIVVMQFAINKPYLIIYFVVFQIFSGIDPYLYSFSLGTYLIILLVIIDIVRFKRSHDMFYFNLFSKEFKWIYLFILLTLIVDIIIAPIINSSITIQDISNVVVFAFKRTIRWFLIIYYFQKFIHTKKRIKDIMFISIIAFMIPASLAILQSINFAPALKIALALSNNPEGVWDSYSIGRFSGNFHSFLSFSYLGIPIIFFAIFLSLCKANYRYLFFFFVGFISIALLVNQTRSVLFGIFVGFFILLTLLKKKIIRNAVVIILFILFMLNITGITPQIKSSERLNVLKYSGQSSLLMKSLRQRLDLFLPTLNLIIHNPQGVGQQNFRNKVLKYGDTVPLSTYQVFLQTTSHNQFLIVGGYYGILSIIIMMMLYIFVLKKLLHTHFNDYELEVLKFSLIAWLVAYIINGQGHNVYPYGDIGFTIPLGIFYTLMCLKKKELFKNV